MTGSSGAVIRGCRVRPYPFVPIPANTPRPRRPAFVPTGAAPAPAPVRSLLLGRRHAHPHHRASYSAGLSPEPSSVAAGSPLDRELDAARDRLRRIQLERDALARQVRGAAGESGGLLAVRLVDWVDRRAKAPRAARGGAGSVGVGAGAGNERLCGWLAVRGAGGVGRVRGVRRWRRRRRRVGQRRRPGRGPLPLSAARGAALTILRAPHAGGRPRRRTRGRGPRPQLQGRCRARGATRRGARAAKGEWPRGVRAACSPWRSCMRARRLDVRCAAVGSRREPRRQVLSTIGCEGRASAVAAMALLQGLPAARLRCSVRRAPTTPAGAQHPARHRRRAPGAAPRPRAQRRRRPGRRARAPPRGARAAQQPARVSRGGARRARGRRRRRRGLGRRRRARRRRRLAPGRAGGHGPEGRARPWAWLGAPEFYSFSCATNCCYRP